MATDPMAGGNPNAGPTERPSGHVLEAHIQDRDLDTMGMLESGIVARAAKFWFLSLLVACLLVLAAALFLFTQTAPPAGDISAFPAKVQEVWSFLRIQGSDAWWLVSVLVGVVAALATLFIASILAGRGETDLGWPRLARQMSKDIIFSATPFLALLGWLGLPSVLQQGTFLGIPVLVGVTMIAAVFRQLAMPPSLFRGELDRARKASAQLSRECALLHARCQRYLSTRRQLKLSAVGWAQLAGSWALVGVAVFGGAWFGVGLMALFGGRGEPSTWWRAWSIVFCLGAIHSLLGATYSKDSALMERKHRRWPVVVVVVWSLMIVAALVLAARQSGLTPREAGGPIAAIVGVPVFYFGAAARAFGLPWFSYYRWRICIGRAKRYTEQALGTNALLEAQEEDITGQVPNASVAPAPSGNIEGGVPRDVRAVALVGAVAAVFAVIVRAICAKSGAPRGSDK